MLEPAGPISRAVIDLEAKLDRSHNHMKNVKQHSQKEKD
jgi:hypothetical protein